MSAFTHLQGNIREMGTLAKGAWGITRESFPHYGSTAQTLYGEIELLFKLNEEFLAGRLDPAKMVPVIHNISKLTIQLSTLSSPRIHRIINMIFKILIHLPKDARRENPELLKYFKQGLANA